MAHDFKEAVQLFREELKPDTAYLTKIAELVERVVQQRIGDPHTAAASMPAPQVLSPKAG